MAPSGLWGMIGSSLPAFGEKRRKTEVSIPHCFINRSELGKVGGLVIGAQRRASIFRFRSAHNGKSFGIAANAEMTDVLSGAWNIPLVCNSHKHINHFRNFTKMVGSYSKC